MLRQLPYMMHAHLIQWCTSQPKYTEMTLVMSMLQKMFPLCTKTQDYHLMYPNVLVQMPQYMIFFSLTDVTYVDK